MRRSQIGFTLLELMIVVAVIAILAIIGLPMYTEQVRKGKRAEAVRALGDLQLRQESYRSEFPTYGNMTAATRAAGNFMDTPQRATDFNNGLKYYTISATLNAADDETKYILTATRKGDLANDPKCGNFRLTVDKGVITKDVTSGDADYCWRK